MQPIRLVAVVASLTLVVVVLDLVRRRRIKEELWFVWLVGAIAPLVFSVWLAPWAFLARALGMQYEPTLLLILGIFFAIALLLHFTTVLSSLMQQNQRLAQEVARLTWRLEQVERGTARP